MLAGLVWLCCAQAASPDALLARIREHMSQVVSSLPNYTCRLTMERTMQLAGQRQVRPVDTVRLEVSFVDGEELYAWPGADKFGEQRLEEMLSDRAVVGTGAFAMHADFLFRRSGPVFTYRGEEVEEGRRLLWYDFHVPRNVSRFYVGVRGGQIIVGYHGSVRVDAQSLDLVRLQLEADDLPVETGGSDSGDTVEYARRAIGDTEFLLPVAAEMFVVDTRGNRSSGRVRFDACRQYTGSSVLHFGEPVDSGRPVATKVGAALPAGLTLELELETAVELSRAAIGDPITAVLASDVRKDGVVQLSKGARFSGRLTRVERLKMSGTRDYGLFGVRFDSVVDGNVRAPFRARLERVAHGRGKYYVPSAQRLSPASGWSALAGLRTPRTAAGEGLFLTRGPLRLPAGLRMQWFTVP